MNNVSYYFCDLKTKDITCPKMHECKRYEPIKDVPYDKYSELGFAKLHNICNDDNGYKMFLKMDKTYDHNLEEDNIEQNVSKTEHD
jgi:hypothetical protein